MAAQAAIIAAVIGTCACTPLKLNHAAGILTSRTTPERQRVSRPPVRGQQRERKPGTGPGEERRAERQCDGGGRHALDQREWRVDQQCDRKIKKISQRRRIVHLLARPQPPCRVEIGGKGRAKAARMRAPQRGQHENGPGGPADPAVALEQRGDRCTRVPCTLPRRCTPEKGKNGGKSSSKITTRNLIPSSNSPPASGRPAAPPR